MDNCGDERLSGARVVRSPSKIAPTDPSAAVLPKHRGRLYEALFFFVIFWRSTPHPIAQMSLVVTWAVVVALINDNGLFDAGLTLDSYAGRMLTTILAFLIVFRTNQSYSRWWEGRTLWAQLHWSCLETAQQAAAWIEDPALALRITNFAIAMAYTVKQYLRRAPLDPRALESVVDPLEVKRMSLLTPGMAPYYCTDVIRKCTRKGLAKDVQSFGAQSVARGLDINVAQMSSHFAAMARINDTPQPACFHVLLRAFSMVYLAMLPVATWDLFGYWIIPEVLFTSYLMLGLQMAATYLEGPFGYDSDDLELDEYLVKVASQCKAAFLLGKRTGDDLTLPDGGASKDADPLGEAPSQNGDNGLAQRDAERGTSHRALAVDGAV